ncbi:MAG: hypothetical protein RR461_01170 [Angelakisella sp.]
MSDFQKGWRGAAMGLGAYLVNVLLVSLILTGVLGNFSLRNFLSGFLGIAAFGFIIGIVFAIVGAATAVAKGPRGAVKPLIITSVIVLCSVGGCFGLLGIY